jgi:sulfur carrier protein
MPEALPLPHQVMKIILPDKICREAGPGPVTVEALLQELGFDPIEVIVARNGTLVTEDAVVEKDDEVRVIRIAHGG